MTKLKIYKITDEVEDVVQATEQSACFDIKAYLHPSTEVVRYTQSNIQQRSMPVVIDNIPVIFIYPGDRVLVPTGLIFDIPEGYSVRLHPRSGTALKYGITLANAEGVIDSDYFHQTYIAICNDSSVTYTVHNGDRICQAELVKKLEYTIEYTTVKPEQKTDRVGGFNSTGV